jgi:hypothetical protein
MARYIVMRTLPSLSPEQLQNVCRNVVAACKTVGEMEWVRSHITADGKHSFCEFIAPSADSCRQHSEVAGLTFDDIIEVNSEIGPTMFA